MARKGENWPQSGPPTIVVPELEDSLEESPICTSEEDEACYAAEYTRPADVSSDYRRVQRLFSYIKVGDETVTTFSLAYLKSLDLTTELIQLAIKDVGGLEILINLLETDDLKCKLGALYVLTAITSSYDVRKSFTDLGGIPLLIELLSDQVRELHISAAETLANVARIWKARMIFRKCGGIPKLVDLLDVSQTAVTTKMENLTADQRKSVEAVRAGARALWTLSKSNRNRDEMRKAGVIKLLARLLKSTHPDVIVPIIGIIQRCASEASFQLAIPTEGMTEQLVKHLRKSTSSIEIKILSASAIFKCAENERSRQLVRQHGGLDHLVTLAKDLELRTDKSLLAAVTGAIWKCAICPENVRRLDELQTVRILVQLLEDENEEVLTNVVGGLAECCKTAGNREILRKAGGISRLVELLKWTNQPLRENVASVLGEAAQEEESLAIIIEQDGLRLMWSLLKNESPRVQANVAWALCPMIQLTKDSGIMVRNFVGGLELLVSLLSSSDIRVLACVCAAISKVAEDKTNLALISDLGVVPMLCRLVETVDDRLREHLASAIASCCGWETNAYEFGQLGAIYALVNYMGGTDKAVHRTTARALHMLSANAENCIALHQSGVVVYLLETIDSPDEQLQASAAGCLANVRKLALSSVQSQFTSH